MNFPFENSECDILDKPLSHVDTTECYIDLLSRKLNEELLCCYTRTWIVYQHFFLWFKHNKKTGNGNNKSMGCRTNRKRSRNKGRSYVSRLRRCKNTCSYWDVIWCATPVVMNGRHSTREEIRTLALRGKGFFTFPPQTRRAHFTALNESNFKSFAPNACKRSWQLNVLWKMQLGNVLWKSGHISNSVCFHPCSLMKNVL